MNQSRTEVVGKLFVVVNGMRRCLICDRVFTREAAAEHAGITCFPRSLGASSTGRKAELEPCLGLRSPNQHTRLP